ncbi:LegC2/C7 family Dot/Icm T4SS effector [Legionella quateirensis]|uniref:Inclusion membrane protein A n=1 Tax=Legionella quateirensis TaxID=45072 RepID=A0A378KZ32_9GAMM|nr:LegC2/C7 family Dot/Icm T4SS effector [Legionella quateirensis]KTD46442.1 inclusion membrane protein A [Legionella quateirensis]STY18777.1 inclusion membrane protein A [Legionella quateirensis]
MGVQETELQEQQNKLATKPKNSELEPTESHPLQTTELPETLEDLTSLEIPKIELESLHKINSAKNDLIKVKETLGSIIDTMANNPSLISRAAKAWGELPLWQKILGGVVVSGPVLAAGLFAHVGVLMVIGGVNGLAYTASGIILDDHHVHTVDIANKLKEGIFSLADLLQITINALEKIVASLQVEVEKFIVENAKLANNVTELKSEVTSLTAQVEIFVATQSLLRETRDDLDKSAKKLKESVEAQTELLVENQVLLDKVKVEYQKNEQQLSAKVAELQAVKDAMDKQIQQATIVSTTLQGAVETMAGTMVQDEEKRARFQQQLDEFLTGKKDGFHNIAWRICEAETKLAELTGKLNDTQKHYDQLLVVQEGHVKRLERIVVKPDTENVDPNVKTVKGLHEHSIYKQSKQAVAVEKAETPSLTTRLN